MSVIDFSDTIIAKSDQLNAADIADEKHIVITDAKKIGDKDQPVHIYFEGCDGKPWKPCKGMRRVIASIWGSKVDLKGREIVLINDPTVTWSGQEVGGIRIKAMSDISEKKSVPVRLSKHKVAKHTILPIQKKTSNKQEIIEETVDIEHYLKLGEEAAKNGVDSYKQFLKDNESIKKHIKHKHAEWSKIALESDTEEDEETL
jgi:hypothetical protein